MTDTTLAGLQIAERLEHSTECAHITFPEVGEVEWMPALLGGMVDSVMQHLSVLAQDPAGIDPMAVASAIEHATIIAAAAGMTAGKAIATEDLLDSFEAFHVDSLGDFIPEDFTMGEE